MSNPPSLSDFTATVREAFSFLGRFGFREVTAPSHRAADPFEIWFGAEDRFVVVAGEGYGTVASVKRRADQLAQIREVAQRLERYGADFLSGDLWRFVEKANRLPPYKKPSD